MSTPKPLSFDCVEENLTMLVWDTTMGHYVTLSCYYDVNCGRDTND